MIRHLSALLLLICFCFTTAFASVDVFPVQGGNPPQLAEALRQQLPDRARVSSYQNKIIVQGEEEDLQLAARLLKALDQPQTQLIIRVRQTVRSTQAGTEVGGRVRLGTGPDSISAYGQRRLANTKRTADQRLQVLLGESAFILVGKDVPYTRDLAAFAGRRTGVATTTDYLSVDTGFVVRPFRLQNDKVLVEITPQMQAVEGDDRLAPVVTGQQTKSTVAIGLGVWFPLSSSVQQGDKVGQKILAWRAGGRFEQREVWIRIDR